MTKAEGVEFIEHLIRRYDQTWRHPILYDMDCWWIEFKDMVKDSTFMICIDNSYNSVYDNDSTYITFFLTDEYEEYQDEVTVSTLSEAYIELETFIKEAVEFGYFYNR